MILDNATVSFFHMYLSTFPEPWVRKGPWRRIFSGNTVVKNLPANSGDLREVGLIPGSERFPAVGNGNPLQYSCLENSMDRGAWWATSMGSQTVRHDWAYNATQHLYIVSVLIFPFQCGFLLFLFLM